MSPAAHISLVIADMEGTLLNAEGVLFHAYLRRRPIS
jgi:hypothetical protein